MSGRPPTPTTGTGTRAIRLYLNAGEQRALDKRALVANRSRERQVHHELGLWLNRNEHPNLGIAGSQIESFASNEDPRLVVRFPADLLRTIEDKVGLAHRTRLIETAIRQAAREAAKVKEGERAPA